uniref:Uncharacterized protein n=1 Tax=Aegilops tauschii subsp. strangulata TaxID=200361 RepID=A0A453B7V7_AEGTS
NKWICVHNEIFILCVAGSTKISENQELAYGYSVTRLGLGLVPAVFSLLSAIVAHTMDLPEARRRPLVEPLLA